MPQYSEFRSITGVKVDAYILVGGVQTAQDTPSLRDKGRVYHLYHSSLNIYEVIPSKGYEVYKLHRQIMVPPSVTRKANQLVC